MDQRTTIDKQLFEAVKNNKTHEVENLLSRAADIAAKDRIGDTVLHLAASRGQENVFRVLIKADKWKEVVNIKDASGRTALHNCCMLGHTGTTTLLLENGADAAAKDQGGWTALHHAAGEGQLTVVKFLVKHMTEHHMDRNQKTNNTGGTALHIAADRGFARIVDELMNNGVRNTTTGWDGETVLHWALEGALTSGNGLNGENEAGPEVHRSNLHDEVFDFDDNCNIPFVGWHQEGTARDSAGQYDAVFGRILKDMSGKARWSELLKVARREERLETVQYLMSKMYRLQIADCWKAPLRRIWLAMSESRTQELMKMLWGEAQKALTQEMRKRLQTEAGDNTESMKKWDSMEQWDILSLATSLGKFQTVYWLLRSRRWSKSDIDKAKSLQSYDRLNQTSILQTDGRIWNTPFVHDEKSGGESYRWHTIRPDGPNLDRVAATILDFHRVDNQIVSIFHDCNTRDLIHRGINHGPRRTIERSMKSLRDSETRGVVTNEYSDASRCYRWIHLAVNSVPWMKDMAMVSYLEKQAKKEDWMATWQFFRRSWQELPENKDEESYMRPNCLRENLSQPQPKPGEQSTTPKYDGSMRLALYMPYLTFGPFENTSPHDAYLRNEHKRGILHRSRTLDQFYHSMQDEERTRDKNQVFTRYVDREEKGKAYRRKPNDTQFNILRVNQLWLWVVDERTVITSTTHGSNESEDPVFERFLKRLCQSHIMFNREATPSSVDSFVKLITSFYINALDNLKVLPKVPSAQAVQESSDGQNDVDQAHRTENTTCNRTGSTTNSKKPHTSSLAKVFADSIEYNNVEEGKLRKEFRNAMKDKTSRSGDLHDSIVQAMNVLDDIKDIRDELNIINSVVQEQRTVWSQLFNQSPGSSTWDDASKKDYESHQWSNTDPDYVSKRVRDLLREAQDTEHNITSVLELEMNQLNVSEAEEARRQGETLRAFTITTAVFLPLSFLASLFALNVSTFPHSGSDVQYQPGWIFGIMFGATLAFILFLLLTVFQEVFFGTIAKVFTKLQLLLGKDPGPTGPHRGEIEQTAGENGRKSLKKRWQELRGRRRSDDPHGVEP